MAVCEINLNDIKSVNSSWIFFKNDTHIRATRKLLIEILNQSIINQEFYSRAVSELQDMYDYRKSTAKNKWEDIPTPEQINSAYLLDAVNLKLKRDNILADMHEVHGISYAWSEFLNKKNKYIVLASQARVALKQIKK